MNLVATLGAFVPFALASSAPAAVVSFQNHNSAFDWRCVVDGNASQATWLDITQPATQSGASSAHAFYMQRFTGFSTPHFNEDRIVGVTADARIARRPTSIALTDEEGIINSFAFARSFAPGSEVGAGLSFHQSAHVAVTNFYTQPLIERLLPTGFVGVSVLLDDGLHYGWIELAAVENPGGIYIEYDVVSWGYETQAGVGIVIPAPASGLVAGGLGLCGLARRRRMA